jgi:predicted porin
MKIKMTILILGAGLGCAKGAAAQSNVTLYGLIDMSVPTYQTHAAANGKHVIGMGVNGEPYFSGSRWGLTGAEDIGGGTKVIFRLESEFRTSDGNMEDANQIFDRDAWVGIQDERFGKITAGYQNTIARDVANIYGDAYGAAALSTGEGGFSNVNNFKQLIFYAAGPTGTRYRNSVAWKKLFKNGLFASAGYQFSNSTSFGNNSAYQGALGYNGGPFNVAGFYSHVNRLGHTNRTESIGGNYTFDILRFNAGYFHYTGDQGSLGQRRDNAWTVSFILAPKGALDYHLGYMQMRTKNAAYDADGYTPAPNVGDYSPTGGVASGFKETLYGAVFYHFSKRTEVYVAGDYMRVHGGFRSSSNFGYGNQLELTGGIRTRF